MIKEILRPNHCIRICDKCGDEKKVNYWNIKNKLEHLCSVCSNKSSGIKKRGQYKAWNKDTINQNISGNYYINNGGYKSYYIGDKSYKGGYVTEHRIVMELYLDRRLKKGEVVHHIDGNKLNNNISNLLLTDKKIHKQVHHSLEKLSFKLIQKGLIKFENNQYFIEPNMWEHISKSLELLENPTPNEGYEDNQQQSPLGKTKEECSTTIQKWSTLK